MKEWSDNSLREEAASDSYYTAGAIDDSGEDNENSEIQDGELLYDSDWDDDDLLMEQDPDEKLYLENPRQFKGVKIGRFIMLGLYLILLISCLVLPIPGLRRYSIVFVVGIAYSIFLIRKSLTAEKRAKDKMEMRGETPVSGSPSNRKHAGGKQESFDRNPFEK